MYRHQDSQLCFKDSVHKDWKILVVEDNFTITNELLYQDELTITDPLCSKDDITLGCCESVTLEFKVTNTGRSYKNKNLVVSLVLDHHDNNPIPIGKFKVDSEEIEEDQRVRSVKAYDDLYTINNKDFAPWFNNLPNPSLTLKDFRDGFFKYAGVEQETVELVNDNVPFTFKITNSSATKRMLEEEKERMTQLQQQAELGVSLYNYTKVDLDTYDPTKKKHKEEYNEVTPQTGANPYANGWYVWDTTIENYRKTTSTETKVKFYVKDPVPVVDPPAGSNPKEEDWYEYKTEGKKTKLKPSTDTTVQDGKTYYTVTKVYTKYYEKTETDYFDPAELGWYIWYDNDWKYADDTVADPLVNYFIREETKAGEVTITYKDAVIIANANPPQNPSKLNWFEWDPYKSDYVPTTDTTVDPTKDYYEQVKTVSIEPTYKEVTIIANAHQNPSELNWYEKNETTNTHFLSTDTEVDSRKDYYEKSVPANRSTAFIQLNTLAHLQDNPKELGYYELVDAADGKDYVKSEDTHVDQSKTYYKNIWGVDPSDIKEVIEDKILGSEIIQAICEINGCFGHIDRTGKFVYIRLKPIDFEDEGLYPDSELYPDPNLYPQGQPYDELITRDMYESIDCKGYNVQKIDRLVICKEDGDAGYVYPVGSSPEGHNTYRITGNFIWYSFTGNKDVLNMVGQNLLTQGIAQVSTYTPCEIEMMGNPCYEVGDTIKIETRTGNIYTYLLSRTLSGSQRLKDSIEVKGNEKRQTENSIYDAVIELKGKSNILTRNADETRSEIIDVAEGLTSLIKQTAESIEMGISHEIKGVDDKVTEKYSSAIKYTDQLISQYVSKVAYNNDKEEIEEWKAGISIEYDNITAEVSNTVKQTGEKNGFKWVLREDGFILSACGQYSRIDTHPAEDLVPIDNPGNKNPFEEQWHEQVAGVMTLTTDTTPQSGKTYYRSRLNPKTEGWYDTKTGTYALTNDENIHTDCSYYTRGGSSEYKDVFICNSQGIKVDGYIATDRLDVSTFATFAELRATNVAVDSLEVANGLRVQEIGALDDKVDRLFARSATIDDLRSVGIHADRIDATYITAGTMSADRIKFKDHFVDLSGTSGNLLVTQVNATKLILDRLDLCSWGNSAGQNRHVPKWMNLTINGQTIHYLGYED